MRLGPERGALTRGAAEGRLDEGALMGALPERDGFVWKDRWGAPADQL